MSVKESITLSTQDRSRLDELTEFYRHLNGVIETIIDKFTTMEKVTNKFLKAQTVTAAHISAGIHTPLSPMRQVTSDLRM